MRRHATRLVMTFLAIVAGAPGAACRREPPAPAGAAAAPRFDASKIVGHIRALSSDAFEGRSPGTRGEELTVAYIADQFRQAGLAPGARDGSFLEQVPLVGITGRLGPLTVRKGAASRRLEPGRDVVAWSKRAIERVALADSELVFVGYGVAAPLYGWDDFKGIDLSGKTIVMLIGDPPVADPADPGRLDARMFGGPAMTYFGRWNYKFDEAAARGAAGALIVHETGPAGYPFSVVQVKLEEQFDLVTPDRGASRAAVEGWITIDAAKALFALAGRDFDALKRQAAAREFRPVPLGLSASIEIANAIRTVDSRNVIGRLDGADPEVAAERIIYTAHWDHLGVAPGNGPIASRVKHGAVDNASGVAALIETARAFASAPAKPRRSLVFLSVTAEEQYLLGSEHYARHPVWPLAETLAVLNFEMLNVYGPTRDLTIYGMGMSELDDLAAAAAAAQGRTARPDPAPERGWFYRSDHFPFARRGVPAIWAGGGYDYVGRPAGWGQQTIDAFNARDYHQPSDVVKPDWNLDGALQDIEVYYEVGSRVANGARYPQWKAGAEFKALRDAMTGRGASRDGGAPARPRQPGPGGAPR